MSQEQVLQRLEAVTARLELALANRGSSGSGGESKTSATLSNYDDLYNAQVAAFLAASKKFPEIAQISELTEKSFKHVRVVIEATTVCKKPSNPEFVKFLEPIVQSMNAADRFCDKRHAFFPHQKSFFEAVSSLNWLTQTATKPIVEGQLEAADFYLNQILTLGKKAAGDVQTQHREYVATLKALLTGMAGYVGSNFKMGLEWNPKGGALASFTPGAGVTTGGAPTAPDAPPAPEAPNAPPAPEGGISNQGAAGPGGMSAVFASINCVGDNTTATAGFGLKKVTADMKAKNQKDKPILEPKKNKTEASAPKETKKEEKKPARLVLDKGTWFCENYEDSELEIPEVQMKQNVYIVGCKKVTIRIPDKCKSISVDGCKKTSVIFKSVVSTFEIVNSQGCKVQALEMVPNVAIDKTSGFSLILTKESSANPPAIVTSNVSELNLVVPGATDNDDPVELPLPEQYLTRYDPQTKKLTTEPVTHGG